MTFARNAYKLMLVRQGNPYERKENMNDMSDAAFNAMIDLLADLIKAKATTVEEAEQIVRQAKIEA